MKHIDNLISDDIVEISLLSTSLGTRGRLHHLHRRSLIVRAESLKLLGLFGATDAMLEKISFAFNGCPHEFYPSQPEQS